MWPSIAFATLLLVVSAALLTWHVQTWRRVSRDEVDERTYGFLRRQFHRRRQASATIGMIGFAVIGGIWVRNPVAAIIYWSCVALAVFWMGLLALADLASSRTYYGRLRKQQLAERAALQAELDRIRGREGNGRSRKPKGGSSDHERL